jgi:hypothetical protein
VIGHANKALPTEDGAPGEGHAERPLSAGYTAWSRHAEDINVPRSRRVERQPSRMKGVRQRPPACLGTFNRASHLTGSRSLHVVVLDIAVQGICKQLC